MAAKTKKIITVDQVCVIMGMVNKDGKPHKRPLYHMHHRKQVDFLFSYVDGGALYAYEEDVLHFIEMRRTA